LTTGQRNSNEKSKSDLLFEFKMTLIQFCQIDSNP
jgi:hypothetical protein